MIEETKLARATEDRTDPILDGAVPQTLVLPGELDAERRIASDVSAPLEERLEAFENIIDSEIGDTQMSRARNIERETGLRQIYLKFDGGNPTGTQKDRIAFAQCRDAIRRGFISITPIHVDLTRYQALDQVAGWVGEIAMGGEGETA